LETGTSLHSEEKRTNWSKKPNDIPRMLLASLRLSVVVLTLFELDDGWKLFYSGVEPAQLAQAEVDILVSPQLASCVDEWIPLGGRVCMLRLKLLGRSQCLI